jgi:hypothetical protein
MTWLLRNAIAALYPRTATLPGIEDCGLDAYLAKFRAESTPLVWLGAVAGALVFQLTPIFYVFVPLPAFLLPAAVRERHAQRVATTEVYLIRQAIFMVKFVAGLCWGADPKVRAAFALPPLPADPGTWRTQ